MISVSEAVSLIVKQSPLLYEGMSRGLLNSSAIARDIKTQVEEHTHKSVTPGAINMALKRLSDTHAENASSHKIFATSPDIIIRSNLFEVTLVKSPTMLGLQRQLIKVAATHRDQYFLTVTSGIFETTIIASLAIHDEIKTELIRETVVSEILGLASITIRLSEDIVLSPGAYSQILGLIAWEGINIIEVVSTYLELTIVINEINAARGYAALKTAFA